MNQQHTSVKFTHIPTDITAIGYDHRCGFTGQKFAQKRAMSLLKAKIAKWVEGNEQKQLVRSWHIHTPKGVKPFVKNEQTGKSFPFDSQMFNGRIDEFLNKIATL